MLFGFLRFLRESAGALRDNQSPRLGPPFSAPFLVFLCGVRILTDLCTVRPHPYVKCDPTVHDAAITRQKALNKQNHKHRERIIKLEHQYASPETVVGPRESIPESEDVGSRETGRRRA